jgi:nucleotide-binding universal stress UspA family protein
VHVSVLVARPAADGASTVLAATDFSEAAEPALAAAADEAARRGASLALVHALDVAHPALAAFDASAVLPSVTVEALRTACREMLEAARERLHASGPVHVVDGAPPAVIAHTAKDLHAALVVVGTHGRTGLRRLALGSVAEAVIRRAHCSVLVVRPS